MGIICSGLNNTRQTIILPPPSRSFGGHNPSRGRQALAVGMIRYSLANLPQMVARDVPRAEHYPSLADPLSISHCSGIEIHVTTN